MKVSGHRRSIVLLLCCALMLAAFSFPAVAQKPAAEPTPLPEDPLGRSTPYGAVIGFLQAANKGEYEACRQISGGQAVRPEKSGARAQSACGPEPGHKNRRGGFEQGARGNPGRRPRRESGKSRHGNLCGRKPGRRASPHEDSRHAADLAVLRRDPAWRNRGGQPARSAVGRGDLAGIVQRDPLPVLPAFHVAQRAHRHSAPGRVLPGPSPGAFSDSSTLWTCATAAGACWRRSNGCCSS